MKGLAPSLRNWIFILSQQDIRNLHLALSLFITALYPTTPLTVILSTFGYRNGAVMKYVNNKNCTPLGRNKFSAVEIALRLKLHMRSPLIFFCQHCTSTKLRVTVVVYIVLKMDPLWISWCLRIIFDPYICNSSNLNRKWNSGPGPSKNTLLILELTMLTPANFLSVKYGIFSDVKFLWACRRSSLITLSWR